MLFLMNWTCEWSQTGYDTDEFVIVIYENTGYLLINPVRDFHYLNNGKTERWQEVIIL